MNLNSKGHNTSVLTIKLRSHRYKDMIVGLSKAPQQAANGCLDGFCIAARHG